MELLFSLFTSSEFANIAKYGAAILAAILVVFGIRRTGKKDAEKQAEIDQLQGTLKNVKSRQDVESRLNHLSPDERRRMLDKWSRDKR